MPTICVHNLLLHIGFVVIVVCYWNKRKGGGAVYKILPATYRLRELHQQFINISREASKGWKNNNNFGSVYMCACVRIWAGNIVQTHTHCVCGFRFSRPVRRDVYKQI